MRSTISFSGRSRLQVRNVGNMSGVAKGVGWVAVSGASGCSTVSPPPPLKSPRQMLSQALRNGPGRRSAPSPGPFQELGLEKSPRHSGVGRCGGRSRVRLRRWCWTSSHPAPGRAPRNAWEAPQASGRGARRGQRPRPICSGLCAGEWGNEVGQCRGEGGAGSRVTCACRSPDARKRPSSRLSIRRLEPAANQCLQAAFKLG